MPDRARTFSLEIPVNQAPVAGPHEAFIPAYFGPWEAAYWTALRSLAPAAVVVNPENGPGTGEHNGYRVLVADLERAGTEVFGYISTDWLRWEMSCSMFIMEV